MNMIERLRAGESYEDIMKELNEANAAYEKERNQASIWDKLDEDICDTIREYYFKRYDTELCTDDAAILRMLNMLPGMKVSFTGPKPANLDKELAQLVNALFG